MAELAREQKFLVAATTNGHKIAEIAAVLGVFGYSVISRAEAGVPDFEIEEDGETFEENSLLKARAIFDFLGGKAATIADDSGIEVDALAGAPGVWSARFAGPDELISCAVQSGRSQQDLSNNAKLLRLLADVPAEKRSARFVAVITCLRPEKPPLVCRGEVEGHIGFSETGGAGFGYDPLFIPLGYEYSFGLFAPEDKNAISHRGRALEILAEKLAAKD